MPIFLHIHKLFSGGCPPIPALSAAGHAGGLPVQYDATSRSRPSSAASALGVQYRASCFFFKGLHFTPLSRSIPRKSHNCFLNDFLALLLHALSVSTPPFELYTLRQPRHNRSRASSSSLCDSHKTERLHLSLCGRMRVRVWHPRSTISTPLQVLSLWGRRAIDIAPGMRRRLHLESAQDDENPHFLRSSQAAAQLVRALHIVTAAV